MFSPRHLALLAIVVAFLALLAPKPRKTEFDPAVCAGPPLRSAQERNDAMEAGYAIHPMHGCIEKQSFDAVNAENAAWEARQAARVAGERAQLARAGQGAFAQARHGFQTTIATRNERPASLPQPPAELFVRSDYRNPQNQTLAGFISPDPGDGRRHPAIIWLTGGDSNSLDDFWTPGPDANDQSARAFREAGIIMVFPTLRGGNGGGDRREWLLGEVDDVLAAAAQLARIRYVDPDRIYLGGHSTGGTLALLVAAMKTPFQAVFAFGPVARIEAYAPALVPVDFASVDPLESRLRSPIHWLADIAQPTFVIEGADEPGNAADFDALCAQARNPNVHCLRVPGRDHFSVLRGATLAIAAKIAGARSAEPLALTATELQR